MEQGTGMWFNNDARFRIHQPPEREYVFVHAHTKPPFRPRAFSHSPGGSGSSVQLGEGAPKGCIRERSASLNAFSNITSQKGPAVAVPFFCCRLSAVQAHTSPLQRFLLQGLPASSLESQSICLEIALTPAVLQSHFERSSRARNASESSHEGIRHQPTKRNLPASSTQSIHQPKWQERA